MGLPAALNNPVALRLAWQAQAVVNAQAGADAINRAIHRLGCFACTVVTVEDGGHTVLAYCVAQGIAHRNHVLGKID